MIWGRKEIAGGMHVDCPGQHNFNVNLGVGWHVQAADLVPNEQHRSAVSNGHAAVLACQLLLWEG